MFAERNGAYRPNECLVRKLCDTGNDTRCNYYIYRVGVGSNSHNAQVLAYNDDLSGFKTTTGSAVADDDKLRGNLLNKKEFWDHIALTYDAATRTATLYRNYAVVKSFTFDEGYSKQKYIDTPLQIGGCGRNVGGTGVCGTNFGGLIDEVRISDVALAPSQFLRLCSPNALPETTTYVDFSAATNLSAFAAFTSDASSAFIGCYANSAPVAANSRREGAKVNGKSGSGIVSDDLPGGDTRPGLLSDVAVANEKAAHVLTNVLNNTNSGYVKVPGLGAVADSSATVEFFFKAQQVLPQDGAANEDAKDAAYLLDLGECNVRVYRKYREVNMRLYGNNYGPPECGDSLRIDDGEWHHLAYVYDRDAGSEVFYLDGQRIFGQRKESLKSGSHTLGLSDGADYVMVLGNNSYSSVNGGYTMTDTVFDEIRVTKKALRPCEFLTALPKEGTPALAWYSFEGNSLANGVYDEAIGAGALSGAAGFSTRTPGKTDELLDSEGTRIRGNSTSLKTAGGKAVWPRNSLLERADLTVEFFAKMNAPSANAGLVTALRSASGTNSTDLAASDAMWSVRVGSDGKTPKVYVNGETVAFPAASALGGIYRHYAVAFVPENGNTTVKLYFDHALVTTQIITGEIEIPSANGGAIPMVGGVSGGSDASFNGLVDEVRVCSGELTIADMLYSPPDVGFTLIVR